MLTKKHCENIVVKRVFYTWESQIYKKYSILTSVFIVLCENLHKSSLYQLFLNLHDTVPNGFVTVEQY